MRVKADSAQSPRRYSPRGTTTLALLALAVAWDNTRAQDAEEQLFWESVRCHEEMEVRAYLEEFPSGAYVDQAEECLNEHVKQPADNNRVTPLDGFGEFRFGRSFAEIRDIPGVEVEDHMCDMSDALKKELGITWEYCKTIQNTGVTLYGIEFDLEVTFDKSDKGIRKMVLTRRQLDAGEASNQYGMLLNRFKKKYGSQPALQSKSREQVVGAATSYCAELKTRHQVGGVKNYEFFDSVKAQNASWTIAGRHLGLSREVSHYCGFRSPEELFESEGETKFLPVSLADMALRVTYLSQ